MSDTTNEKATKVRAILEGTTLTFPTTGNKLNIATLFPDYADMNDGQKYVVEYGCRQFAQDVIASEPKEGTKAEAQAARIALVLSGKRPTKASTKEPSIKLSDLEANALKLAISQKSEIPINTLLALGAIAPQRAAELKQELETALEEM